MNEPGEERFIEERHHAPQLHGIVPLRLLNGQVAHLGGGLHDLRRPLRLRREQRSTEHKPEERMVESRGFYVG
ncbi:MAG: hypothetical protein V9H26_03250 [Verrucomicrobiota bacterium]